ncbi:DNA polymerase alpha catalytic subunit [Rhynchophorus ferrugineus]|uniref:DNA polymerase alpha catalytic subunit n=1 Tax=Rhynchophorus ferrugineus TaxID=354439 RepID=UPI003FCEC8AB
MSEDERRPKRQKRETSYKAKAFEKFKQLKSGTRNKYEIEEIENVYETVAEKDYVKTVLERQDDDWIVDDDGHGYVEDGRDIFDDDLDYESISQANKKGVKRKKNIVSDSATKGNLQYMLSNMPTKKKEEIKINEDDMLSEILNEIDEGPSCSVKPSQEFIPRKKITQNYMKMISLPGCNKNYDVKIKQENLEPNKTEPCSTVRNNTTVLATSIKTLEAEIIKEESQISNDNTSVTDFPQDDFEGDLDLMQIEEIESQVSKKEVQEKYSASDKPAEKQNNIDFDHFTFNVNNFNETISRNDDIGTVLTDLPLITKDDIEVFRFYWWDAFEDPDKQKGTVFLFGKTFCEKKKMYASCCVAVKNLYRQIFLLPRQYMLDEEGKETDTVVTFKDIYLEFKALFATPLQIKMFKCKFVSKKYAFDPTVPQESDYLEVTYPATDPQINLDILERTPRSFTKIFGINSSGLERFLLEKKLKGPCWLDVSTPELNKNPLSWCTFEVNCPSEKNIVKVEESIDVPPLVVSAINFRHYQNAKTNHNEILMISCITQTNYALDRQQPKPPFNQHFCVFTAPPKQILPLNIHEHLKNYKGTKVQKMDTEKALLNYFVNQFNKIDPDLIVGYDMQGHHINILANRLIINNITTFSKLSKLKRSQKKRLERDLFTGRLVCDIKISAKELIKLRTYDLDALCQHVLKIGDNQRVDLEPDEIPKMYENANDIIKLISYTMEDTAYILKILYDLNILPLALQITNIAGNIMSKTLMGGRSERNEFLLLHAFIEKGFIVPDKRFLRKNENDKNSNSSKKKPTYSGGLVLEPKIGFYDKFLLLMDFNSLYPSIIQEYNICFTTLPVANDDEHLALPDASLPTGILPTEIRKLVDSRRQVKSLMNNTDLSPDLKMQYHIRQMALKLTANSMYGCLGFSNSRFYAKNLAALVTQKGREILTNTKEMVEKMCFEVVYGDTDSIMINTNLLDYDQVFRIGLKIKQEVNKLYKKVELDIDGVFKYLLLLKKKKYAAVTLTKTKDGKIKEEKEYKGLDIVRRDWSQLASEAGKFVLEHILSDQTADDRITNIHNYLRKLKEELLENRVPLQLLVITKQLTKDPQMYPNKESHPHVQVALRYNKDHGGHYRSGDTVCYVICDDGSNKSATQRAYHLEELKSNENIKIDVNYYLSQQIHPVVARICEPIEGTDAYQIAECLGLDGLKFKKTIQGDKPVGENIVRPEIKFRNVQKFIFKCLYCQAENKVTGPLNGNVPILQKCCNEECQNRPVDYLFYIQNQLSLTINSHISKYYECKLICEDPACPNETNRTPLRFGGKLPVCTLCEAGVMYREYSEKELFTQLSYFVHIFDLRQLLKKPLMEESVINAYQTLRQTAENYLNHSSYAIVDIADLFGYLLGQKTNSAQLNETITAPESDLNFSDDDF